MDTPCKYTHAYTHERTQSSIFDCTEVQKHSGSSRTEPAAYSAHLTMDQEPETTPEPSNGRD